MKSHSFVAFFFTLFFDQTKINGKFIFLDFFRQIRPKPPFKPFFGEKFWLKNKEMWRDRPVNVPQRECMTLELKTDVQPKVTNLR